MALIPEGILKNTLYRYWDKRSSPAKIVFECSADNILEADALYRLATKNEPVKQPYVGCQPIPALGK